MSYSSPVVAFLATLLSTMALLHSGFGNRIQDVPNERSLHAAPTPRIGGVGLICGVLAGWAMAWPALHWWLLLPLLGLFAVSLFDDVRGAPVSLRLPAHFAAAALLVAGAGAGTGVLASALLVLLVVWMTNLFNFMDGSDGLAGGMALSGFSFYAMAAMLSGQADLAMLNLSIAASALGFLYFNLRPNKVFMGDAGSIPLGFLAAGMGLWGWTLGCWPAWFPPVVFAPFVVDASVTLVRRTLRGAKITEAHREHYYQRVIRLGWSHRRVALFEYFLMLGTGLTALAVLRGILPWPALLAWGAIYAVLMRWLDAVWKNCGVRHA